MKTLPLLRIVLTLLAALTVACHAEEAAKADFFDIIGESPVEVARSASGPNQGNDMELLVSGFVGLPMSAAHRKEFIEALRADPDSKKKPIIRLCLLNLLDEDKAYEEALVVLRQGAESPDEITRNQIREVAFLWKCGREAEATELAGKIVYLESTPRFWRSLVRVDIIKNRQQEAMGLLNFLEGLPTLSPQIRYSLAIQHLEIARRSGMVETLIDRSTSPVLQAVWNSALGRKERAIENARAAGPTPVTTDIELLMVAMGPDSPAGEYARAALASKDLTTRQRQNLIGRFDDEKVRFERWEEMPTGHGDTAHRIAWSSLPAEMKQRYREIVRSHPEDIKLVLLAAQSDFYGPQETKPLLLEAARTVQKMPESPPFGDPAKEALEVLTKICSPEELQSILSNSPAFGTLPPEDRMRYLMAARLDKQVVATMSLCRFDLPVHDRLGENLIEYLNRRAYRSIIPEEAITKLLDRLPEIVLGSPSGKNNLTSERTQDALTFLAGQKTSESSLVGAANRLVTAAAERSPEIREQVIRGMPNSIWSLPGLAFARPEKKPPSSPPGITPVFLALSAFTPPDISIISGQDTLPWGMSQPDFNDPRLKLFGRVVLDFSPWRQNMRAVVNPQQFDAVIHAKLRTLLDQDRSRTIIYDVMVSCGVVDCPDPGAKALTEQHIATLNTPLPEDPAAGVFLFLQKRSKKEPADKATAVLEGYANYLSPTRQRILHSVRSSMDMRNEDLAILGECLGYPKISVPAPIDQAKPPSDYDRLQFMKEADKLNSPEAIALARDVLFRFVDSTQPVTSPTENISIHALVSNNAFQEFLNDLNSRMEAAGRSELDIQRALYRVHLYRIIHSNGEIYPFAKRVLELDPTDTAAAADVLAAAAEEKDQSLALKAMASLCSKSPFVLARAINPKTTSRADSSPPPSPLSLFTGSEARQVAELMLGMPFHPDDSKTSRPDSEKSELLPLYLYFAQNDISSLRPVMRWTGEFSPRNGRDLTDIADFLVRRKRVPEAIDLLADAYFSPASPSPEKGLLFQPKISPADWSPWSLDVYDLYRLEILKPLAEAASRYEAVPETSKARVAIALAADPTSETWDRIVPPFLAASPVEARPRLTDQLQDLIKHNLPAAEALNRRFALEKQATNTSPPTLDKILSKIRLSSESGQPGTIAPDWAAARGLLAASKLEQRIRFLSQVAWPMAKIAAGPEWQEFIQEARKTEGFPKAACAEFPKRPEANTPLLPQMQELIGIVLSNLQPDQENSYVLLSLFDQLVTSEPPDLEFLQKFRPWIDFRASFRESPQSSPRLQFLDLLGAAPTAASPQLDAIFKDGSWQVSWSMTGYRTFRNGYPFARKFPFLDGLFDLEILAGPYSDRLDVVQTIPAAGATGQADLKLPPGSRFLSLLARKRDGGVVRWATPLEIGDPVSSEALSAPPELERLPGQGPFFLDDAWRVGIGKNSTLVLTQLPWTVGAPPPQLKGWITGDAASRLYLSFRDAADMELEAKPFQSDISDFGGMPLWERFATPEGLTPPAATERIFLVAKTNSYEPGSSFLLAGLRLTTPAPTPDLPAGLTLLGRAPGLEREIVMDSNSNRFAAASQQGIGIFDFSSNRFSGWIPTAPEGEKPDLSWYAFAGDRIVFANGMGEIHVLSTADRVVRKICKIGDFERYQANRERIRISPDGKFLAWSGRMAGIHLMKIDSPGPAKERLFESPQISFLGFDAESRNLEARSGFNRYTLPLADWETARPTVSRDENLREPESRRLHYSGSDSSSQTDERHHINLHTSYNRNLADIAVKNRIVVFPQGLLGKDRDGVPFYIDSYGRILRIDVEKLRGYEPSTENN